MPSAETVGTAWPILGPWPVKLALFIRKDALVRTKTALPKRRVARMGIALVSCSLLVGSIGVGSAPAALADGTTTVSSPLIASDAPNTKTVKWLLSKLTVTEKAVLVRGGTDPDNHGEAGWLEGVPRLGIPAVRHVDAMGINTRNETTAFPTRLGLASSFDRSAYTKLGVQVGKEGMASDIDLIYGPQVDIARFPSWSRNLTTNGEDAYVSAQLAATEIEGIQSQGLLSQVKHVSMYSGQSQSVPSLVSSQAAHEVYLAPAQSAIEDAGVSSVMCSYATFQIVGETTRSDYACSNSNLNNNILKTGMGFKGFVTSDYGGSKATSDLLAGMDNEFSTSNLTLAKLEPLVDTTSSTYDPDYAAALDDAISRILYQYERFGLLDNSKIPAAYQSSVAQHGDVSSADNSTSVDKQAGQAVALELAEQSGVLLKNSDALPLSKAKTVAVVGPTSILMPSSPGGERSRGFGDRNTYTPLKAIQAAAGKANVTSAPGIDWIGATVPSANLQTTDDSTTAVPGLTLSGTDATGAAITPAVVTSLDGKQTNLVKGGVYTWTGYLNVQTADTYQLLLQRPYGSDSGDTKAFNGGVAVEGRGGGAASSMTLAVDGATKTIANPASTVIQSDFPDGDRASNGQYLGKDNQGVSLDLTVGLHQVTITYKPNATTATTPTMRFAWSPLTQNIAKSEAAATAADQTVIFVDDSSAGTAAGGGDNSSTTASLKALNANQATLITKVAKGAHDAGHKVTVVLNSGGAVSMPWAAEVDAILEMWYPGQEGGTATAALLYGDANPSGKLPLTFPKDNDSTPFSGHPERSAGSKAGDESLTTIKWSDGVNVGYRWYTDPVANTAGVTPAYAFGFGLSYTSFDFSGLSVKTASDGGLDVTFAVKNTGSKAGATSPQIYLGASPDLAAPTYDSHGIVTAGFEQSAMKLVQFDHVNLAAGQSKNLSLHVDVQQLSAWDTVAQKWVVGTGERKISLAAASDDIKQSVTKKVLESVVAPVVTTQPASTTTTVGQTVTFTAAATGTPAPTVQWQRSSNGGITWVDVTDATSATYQLKVGATDDGVEVRAVFTNDLGTASSDAATIHVKKVATQISAKLAKSTVKKSQKAQVKTKVTAPVGYPVTGTVSVTVKYGSKTYASISKATTGSLTVTLPKLKAHTYKVTVKYSGTAVLAPAAASTLTLKVKK